jgi:hypothetical protein
MTNDYDLTSIGALIRDMKYSTCVEILLRLPSCMHLILVIGPLTELTPLGVGN